MNRPVRILAALAAALAAHAGNAVAEKGVTRRVIIYPESEGLVITAGKGAGPTRESPDGICDGPGCGDGPPVMPSRGFSGGLATAGRDEEFIREWQDGDFQRFIAAGREGPMSVGMSFPQGGSGMSPPVIDASLRRAMTDNGFLPPAMAERVVGQLRRIEEIDARGHFVSVQNPIDLPPLPGDADMEALIRKTICGPAYEGTRVVNKEELCRNWIGRGRTYLMAAYEKSFAENLEAPARASQVRLLDAITARLPQSEEDGDATVQTLVQQAAALAAKHDELRAGYDRRVTPDFASLRLARVADEAAFASFLLPPDSALRDDVERLRKEPSHRFARREFRQTWSRADGLRPQSHQGLLAKTLAKYLAVQADEAWSRGSRRDRELARRAHAQAQAVIDIALGVLPVVSPVRDLYEAYTGEDLITGEPLPPGIRALKVVFAATAGVGHLSPKAAINQTVEWIAAFGRKLGPEEPEAKSMVDIVSQFGEGWVEHVERLRQVTHNLKTVNPKQGKVVDFGLGPATRDEADLLGRAWVGNDATKLLEPRKNGSFVTVYLSRDGLKRYRPPELKANGRVQANIEARAIPKGKFESNGHLDITD